MTIKAILFDLDGTLSDSLPRLKQANRMTCAKLGRPDLAAKACSLIGVPLLEAGDILLGEGQGEIYMTAYGKVEEALPQPETKPYAGAPEMLAALKQAGVKIAVVTAKQQRSAQRALNCLGYNDYLDMVITADDCAHGKPDPAPALLALTKLGDISPAHAVFVGDTVFDILCGQNAGTKTIGVSWGMPIEVLLERSTPDFLAHTIEELQAKLFAWL